MPTPVETDKYVAWVGSIVAGVVGVGTLIRRWRVSTARVLSAGEEAYIGGTKAALDVLQRQITDLLTEVHSLRTQAGVVRDAELQYVGKIGRLEAQNREQAQEIEELKEWNAEQAKEIRKQAGEINEMHVRLNLLELRESEGGGGSAL